MALGGVGEAMLLSAAIGGGTSALTGGDPLKGALLGAATGWMGGGGISNLLQGNPLADIVKNAATQTALPAATNATAGAAEGLKVLSNGLPPELATGIDGVVTGPNLAGTAPQPLVNVPPGAPSEMTGQLAASTPSALDPTAAEQARYAATSSPGPAGQPLSTKISLLKDPLGYIKDNQFLAGSAALAGALGGQRKRKIPGVREIEGLPIWAYRAKEGGIVALADGGMPGYDMVVGETPMYARGGISDLGTYSDGGRMLKGAGDGMSDSIPGVIAGKRPARLADSEFVVPADVVSHLGNGSTDAGAKQLYKMMDRVRMARTGTKKQGKQINPMKYLPA